MLHLNKEPYCTRPKATKQGRVNCWNRRHHPYGPNTGSLAPGVRNRVQKKEPYLITCFSY